MSSISNTRLIISILQHVPRHPGAISVSELRERLLEGEGMDIPVRNMQRYLAQVKGHFGLDCEDAEPGKAKKWFVENVERRDPKRNTMPASKAFSYILVQKLLTTVAPKTLSKELEPHFNHARFSLISKGKGFADWDKKVRVIDDNLALNNQPMAQSTYETIVEGLLSETQLDVVYKPANAAHPTKYRVSPLGLILKGSQQLLVCVDERCSVRKPKHLYLNCIWECDGTSSPVESSFLIGDDAFDLNEYCEKSRLSKAVKDEKITLIAEVDSRMWDELEDRPISENQKVDSKTDGDNERKILSATLDDNQALRRWLLGWADAITVLEPAALRNEIQEATVNSANNYCLMIGPQRQTG